jgi:hypothetical protein
MLRVLIAVPLAVLALLLMPSKTDAYGAARFGYTHVGPGGFYHVGGYEARGYGGVYGGVHTTAYGYGGAYRGGYGYGVHYGYGGAYGAAAAYGVDAAAASSVYNRVYAPSYYSGYGYYR